MAALSSVCNGSGRGEETTGPHARKLPNGRVSTRFANKELRAGVEMKQRDLPPAALREVSNRAARLVQNQHQVPIWMCPTHIARSGVLFFFPI